MCYIEHEKSMHLCECISAKSSSKHGDTTVNLLLWVMPGFLAIHSAKSDRNSPFLSYL